MQLHGQQILVIGLGASGLAMARWCAAAGATVTVLDDRAAPPQAAQLAQELPAVRLLHGAFDASALELADFARICISPGLAPARLADLLEAARAQAVPVGSELGLFNQALATLAAQQQYAPAVIAITGTNGKTTVTALTGQLVQRAGKTVAVAGNIGPSLLDTLAHAMQAQALPQVWVLELSSFQLHYSEDFAPTVATVLNLSQDHLDWHTDMADYAQAKARVFGPGTLMVLNREDPAVMGMLPAPVRVKLQKPQERAHICFGADEPRRAGDYGLQDLGGMLWLVRAAPADETIKSKRTGGVQEDLFLQKFMPLDALRIHGRHNACNALAALALASAVGCALGPMLFGLREYRGEPHRVQSLGMVAEVEYFDDSKGTNVGATLAALHGLGAQKRLVLIMGGQGKGQDFDPLAHPVARYARAVLLIGTDAPILRAALTPSAVPLHDAQSMQDAVAQAAALAQPGDAVLMSPACASLDMFRDYSHRAQVFTDAVAALAADTGTVLEAFA